MLDFLFFFRIEVTLVSGKISCGRRGRPKKEKGGCVGRFTFHETEDSEYNRKSLEKELGLNGGEVIREALEMFYMIKIGSKQ